MLLVWVFSLAVAVVQAQSNFELAEFSYYKPQASNDPCEEIAEAVSAAVERNNIQDVRTYRAQEPQQVVDASHYGIEKETMDIEDEALKKIEQSEPLRKKRSASFYHSADISVEAPRREDTLSPRALAALLKKMVGDEEREYERERVERRHREEERRRGGEYERRRSHHHEPSPDPYVLDLLSEYKQLKKELGRLEKDLQQTDIFEEEEKRKREHKKRDDDRSLDSTEDRHEHGSRKVVEDEEAEKRHSVETETKVADVETSVPTTTTTTTETTTVTTEAPTTTTESTTVASTTTPTPSTTPTTTEEKLKQPTTPMQITNNPSLDYPTDYPAEDDTVPTPKRRESGTRQESQRQSDTQRKGVRTQPSIEWHYNPHREPVLVGFGTSVENEKVVPEVVTSTQKEETAAPEVREERNEADEKNVQDTQKEETAAPEVKEERNEADEKNVQDTQKEETAAPEVREERNEADEKNVQDTQDNLDVLKDQDTQLIPSNTEALPTLPDFVPVVMGPNGPIVLPHYVVNKDGKKVNNRQSVKPTPPLAPPTLQMTPPTQEATPPEQSEYEDEDYEEGEEERSTTGDSPLDQEFTGRQANTPFDPSHHAMANHFPRGMPLQQREQSEQENQDYSSSEYTPQLPRSLTDIPQMYTIAPEKMMGSPEVPVFYGIQKKKHEPSNFRNIRRHPENVEYVPYNYYDRTKKV